MFKIWTRVQRPERLQHPIQNIRGRLASHVLFFRDLKFEGVKFPATQDFDRWRQSNANQSPKSAKSRFSCRQLTPLGQGGGAVLFEAVSADEVAVLIEVVV